MVKHGKNKQQGVIHQRMDLEMQQKASEKVTFPKEECQPSIASPGLDVDLLAAGSRRPNSPEEPSMSSYILRLL